MWAPRRSLFSPGQTAALRRWVKVYGNRWGCPRQACIFPHRWKCRAAGLGNHPASSWTHRNNVSSSLCEMGRIAQWAAIQFLRAAVNRCSGPISLNRGRSIYAESSLMAWVDSPSSRAVVGMWCWRLLWVECNVRVRLAGRAVRLTRAVKGNWTIRWPKVRLRRVRGLRPERVSVGVPWKRDRGHVVEMRLRWRGRSLVTRRVGHQHRSAVGYHWSLRQTRRHCGVTVTMRSTVVSVCVCSASDEWALLVNASARRHRRPDAVIVSVR